MPQNDARMNAATRLLTGDDPRGNNESALTKALGDLNLSDDEMKVVGDRATRILGSRESVGALLAPGQWEAKKRVARAERLYAIQKLITEEALITGATVLGIGLVGRAIQAVRAARAARAATAAADLARAQRMAEAGIMTGKEIRVAEAAAKAVQAEIKLAEAAKSIRAVEAAGLTPARIAAVERILRAENLAAQHFARANWTGTLWRDLWFNGQQYSIFLPRVGRFIPAILVALGIGAGSAKVKADTRYPERGTGYPYPEGHPGYQKPHSLGPYWKPPGRPAIDEALTRAKVHELTWPKVMVSGTMPVKIVAANGTIIGWGKPGEVVRVPPGGKLVPGYPLEGYRNPDILADPIRKARESVIKDIAEGRNEPQWTGTEWMLRIPWNIIYWDPKSQIWFVKSGKYTLLSSTQPPPPPAPPVGRRYGMGPGGFVIAEPVEYPIDPAKVEAALRGEKVSLSQQEYEEVQRRRRERPQATQRDRAALVSLVTEWIVKGSPGGVVPFAGVTDDVYGEANARAADILKARKSAGWAGPGEGVITREVRPQIIIETEEQARKYLPPAPGESREKWLDRVGLGWIARKERAESIKLPRAALVPPKHEVPPIAWSK